MDGDGSYTIMRIKLENYYIPNQIFFSIMCMLLLHMWAKTILQFFCKTRKIAFIYTRVKRVKSKRENVEIKMSEIMIWKRHTKQEHL